MLEFFSAVARESEAAGCRAILLDIRVSRPIFHFAAHALFEYFRKPAGGEPYRIALLGDTSELQLSHEYLALLAGQQGVIARSFGEEAAAARWLKEPNEDERRSLPDRRRQDGPHFPEQRNRGERRAT